MTSPSLCLWEDMSTDIGLSGCASFPATEHAVSSPSVSGSAPNRIFNIEWRTVLFADNSATQNFEVRLYENDPLRTLRSSHRHAQFGQRRSQLCLGRSGRLGRRLLHAGFLHSYSSAECLQHLYLAWLWNRIANTNTYRNTDTYTTPTSGLRLRRGRARLRILGRLRSDVVLIP